MIRIKLLLAAVLLFCAAVSGCKKRNLDDVVASTIDTTARVYYVSDPTGNDNNNGRSQNAPFKTIAKALPYLQPGDILYFMTGTYSVTSTIALNKSGKPDKYISYVALPGNAPVLYASGNTYNAIAVTGSYVKIDGLELKGDNANLNLAAAQASYNVAASGGALTGVYNTNAISVTGATHVEIRNCKIHDFPAAGIACGTSDYIKIENNTVYNNSWYTIYATSGISVINTANSDMETGYKIFVRNNIVFNNKTLVPWISIKALSDGNGIILDVNNAHTVNGVALPAYNGRTLVENNVCVANGGGGVHAFSANHVDLINNTAYGNGLVVGYPDIDLQSCDDGKIISNIMYARDGGRAQDINKSTNYTVDYNVYYNGTYATLGAHYKVANPLFVSPSTDITTANFQLSSSSPAVNAASPAIFSAKDILGVARPKAAAADCGAYESY